MNPELAKLLGQGQTAPASVAGTPVVNALRKMMGAGGSAPAPQTQMVQNTGRDPADPTRLLQNGSQAGDTPSGPSRSATPEESAFRDANPTDSVVENYARRFGMSGKGRYQDHPGADVYDRAHNAFSPMTTEEELEHTRKNMGKKPEEEMTDEELSESDPDTNPEDRRRGRYGR